MRNAPDDVRPWYLAVEKLAEQLAQCVGDDNGFWCPALAEGAPRGKPFCFGCIAPHEWNGEGGPLEKTAACWFAWAVGKKEMPVADINRVLENVRDVDFYVCPACASKNTYIVDEVRLCCIDCEAQFWGEDDAPIAPGGVSEPDGDGNQHTFATKPFS